MPLPARYARAAARTGLTRARSAAPTILPVATPANQKRTWLKLRQGSIGIRGNEGHRFEAIRRFIPPTGDADSGPDVEPGQRGTVVSASPAKRLQRLDRFDRPVVRHQRRERPPVEARFVSAEHGVTRNKERGQDGVAHRPELSRILGRGGCREQRKRQDGSPTDSGRVFQYH